MTTKKRGGKREGAGRKALAPSQRMVKRTITLPAELIALAEKAGKGNLSKGIRILLSTAY